MDEKAAALVALLEEMINRVYDDPDNFSRPDDYSWTETHTSGPWALVITHQSES